MNNIGTERDGIRPIVAAFSGGKGGVGRSTLVAETALSLGRMGARVLCVDATWAYGGLSRLLHVERDPETEIHSNIDASFEDGTLHIASLIQETPSPNVCTAALTRGKAYPFEMADPNVSWLYTQLYDLEFDWIFIDLPSGPSLNTLNTMIVADLPIIVASPEPASLQLSVSFFRHLLYHLILSHPSFRSTPEMLRVLDKAHATFSLDDLIRSCPNRNCREMILDCIKQFEPYVVFNFVREGSERDLGFVLGYAVWKELGIFPRNLGSVDYEDRRWFYNRRSGGTSRTRGEDTISEDIEKIVRNLWEMEVFDARYPRPLLNRKESNPMLRVGLSPETKRNISRQHTRKIWEGFRREVSLDDVFSQPKRRDALIRELEEVYQTILSMDSARKLEAVSPSTVGSNAPVPTLVSTPSDVQGRGRKPSRVSKTPKLTPEQLRNSPGAIIGELRKDRGMTIQDLSQRTHIGIKSLSAIELMDYDELPRDVYLRGYLREIARTFDIDPNTLINQYLSFLAEHFES